MITCYLLIWTVINAIEPRKTETTHSQLQKKVSLLQDINLIVLPKVKLDDLILRELMIKVPKSIGSIDMLHSPAMQIQPFFPPQTLERLSLSLKCYSRNDNNPFLWSRNSLKFIHDFRQTFLYVLKPRCYKSDKLATKLDTKVDILNLLQVNLRKNEEADCWMENIELHCTSSELDYRINSSRNCITHFPSSLCLSAVSLLLSEKIRLRGSRTGNRWRTELSIKHVPPLFSPCVGSNGQP